MSRHGHRSLGLTGPAPLTGPANPVRLPGFCRLVRLQQITYNMLFRWFVGLAMDAPVWDTVFTKNRDRLLEDDIARGFLAAILANPLTTPR